MTVTAYRHLVDMVKRLFLLQDERPRNVAMEGVRGYAVLLVFFVHCAGTFASVHHGVCFDHYTGKSLATSAATLPVSQLALLALHRSHYGVELFFLLSGFLVLRMLMRQESFSYGTFIWRRLVRIYPAFIVSLAICTLVYVFYLRFLPFEWSTFLKNLAFLNGCPGIRCAAYNYVTWSLFYEVAFYLYFPAVFRMFISARSDASPFRLVAALGVLASVLTSIAWLPRVPMFYFGAIIGLVDDADLRRVAQRLPTFAVVLAYLCGMVAYSGLQLPVSYMMPIYGLGASLLFVKACYAPGVLGRLFSLTPLRALGNISYSFYLMHALAIAVLTHLLSQIAGPRGTSFGLFCMITFAGSLGMSIMLFACCERWYFREPARTAAQGKVAMPRRAAA